MRPFAITVPTIWTGSSGRGWKELGKDYQLMGHYLISSPYSNMYGLYYQPFSAMLDEVGVDHTMAMKVLRHFSETQFAHYDKASNWVWVVNGWRTQLMSWGRVPPPSDKRIVGMHKWYSSCPPNPFLGLFFDEYGVEFNIPARRTPESRVGTPRAITAHPQRPLFEKWSKFYPNTNGMGAAWSQWLQIHPAPTDEFVEQVMLPKLQAQLQTDRYAREGYRFLPNAGRYLEEKRWEDPLEAEHSGSTAGGDEVDAWLSQKRSEAG